jgi:hypothetical protein
MELGGVPEEGARPNFRRQAAEGRIDLLADLIVVETDRMRIVGLEEHPIAADLFEDSVTGVRHPKRCIGRSRT